MIQEQSLENVKSFLVSKYKKNLVCVLILKPEINYLLLRQNIEVIIILKEKLNINLDKEKQVIGSKIISEKCTINHLHTLDSVKLFFKQPNNFFVLLRILSNEAYECVYSSDDFILLKEYLANNIPSKEELKKYMVEKMNFETENYFKSIMDFGATKALYNSIRKQIQLLNYFYNNNFIFDFEKCMNNINLEASEKARLNKLYNYYNTLIPLTDKEIEDIYKSYKKINMKIINFS